MTQLPLPLCQRWRHRSDSWREAGERIDPTRHGVEVVPQSLARPFVEVHHYSGTYPAARLAVGLWRSPRRGRSPSTLAGVAVFSVPMQQSVVPSRLGLPPTAGVELGRLVLLDEVEGDGETWFLARAFDALRDALPEVRGVVSYSDPMPRTTVGGSIVMPGHIGTIYKAHNGRYVGRGAARTLLLDPMGRVISARALSKLRLGEVGKDYAERQLLSAGAPRRHAGESGESYVRRVLASGCLRAVKHPGNHCYVWAVGRSVKERREIVKGLPPGLPYPRLSAADLTPSAGSC